MITEAAAIVRARAFIRRSGIDTVPVDLQKYLATAGAELRFSENLAPTEAGNTMFVRGRHFITVNAHDSPERQRFTVLHEIAHIELGVASKHGDHLTADSLYSYTRRPPEEVICDTFAAECLLPHDILKRDMQGAVAGFAFVEEVAAKYGASLSCASSRVTVNAPFACAYALAQDGHVRFATYSPVLRQQGFWIPPGIAIPKQSITDQCLKAGTGRASGTIPAYRWASHDDFIDVDLTEEVRTLSTFNQSLTLLWLEAGDVPDHAPRRSQREDPDEECLLKELDGQLPWPGRNKRK